MRLALALALALAAAAGCPAPLIPLPGMRACVSDCLESPSSSLDGTHRINLLVRSFLARRELERSTYAFHSYLFFADRSAGRAPARRAAAKAVLTLFSDVGAVKSLRIDDAQLAVLYVPVLSRAAAATMVQRGGVDRLLADYDYDRVRLLKGQIEAATRMTLPRVALLGSARPLESAATIDPAQLYMVDLDGLTDAQAEDRLTRFRDALESRYESLSAYVSPAGHPALGYFEREGLVLASYHGEH